MKSTPHTQLVLLVLVFSTLLCACRTTHGYRQAERTGDRIVAFRDQIGSIQDAIDATGKALDEIVDQADVDPRPAFRRFSRAIDNVERANQTAQRRADDMRAEGRVFFEQWQQEIVTIANPEARDLAERRKESLERQFRNISVVTVEARDLLRPWLSDVRDIQTLLGNDLTIGGIDAAAGLINQVKTDAAKVKLGYDSLVDELNSVAAAMAPVRESLQ